MGTGTELGRVRGLGSAHHGVYHWWHQKVTAGWLSSAWVAVPMLLLVASVFYHFRLGLQVAIEDYAHAQNRVVLMVLLNLFVAVTAGIAIFSILRIAFGAAA